MVIRLLNGFCLLCAQGNKDSSSLEGITLFVTFLGVVAAWIPFVIEKIKPRKIHIKVLSLFSTQGVNYKDSMGNLLADGLAYCIKLTMITNKDMIIKKINLKVKYQLIEEEKSAIVFNGKGLTYRTVNKNYVLKVPTTEYIQNKPFYEKNKPYAVYLTFIINDPDKHINNANLFQYINMEFELPDQHKATYRINATEIDSNDLIPIDYNDFE